MEANLIGRSYTAKVLRVVDGDTLDLDIDLGFYVHINVRVRLYGLNTPEVYGIKKESAEYAKGMEAKLAVEEWVAKHNNDFLVTSHNGEKFKQGKYGRWLILIYPKNGDPSLNDYLLEQGFAEKLVY